MPSLVEVQQALGRALLAAHAADRELPAQWFDGGAEAGLKVHRNTIVAAYVQALKLSYPTIERTLGASLFENLAAEFGRQHPPQAAALDVYGEGFAEFVASRAADDERELLRELARYDWAFERVAHARADSFSAMPAAQLEGGVRLHFSDSLRLFDACYAVDAMRANAVCSVAPAAPRTLAMWRRAEGVAVQPLSAAAAAFVAALLRREALEVALQSATAAAVSDNAAAGAVSKEVLESGFTRLYQ
jgi:hypothetical protein